MFVRIAVAGTGMSCALLDQLSCLDSYGSCFSASAMITRQQGWESVPQYSMRSAVAVTAMGRCLIAAVLRAKDAHIGRLSSGDQTRRS